LLRFDTNYRDLRDGQTATIEVTGLPDDIAPPPLRHLLAIADLTEHAFTTHRTQRRRPAPGNLPEETNYDPQPTCH
jgi:hypothetical protein